MFGTFRKHQSWLWWVIGGLTIISFVAFGPTNAKMGNLLRGGGANFGVLAGKPITRDQLINALREVELDGFLKTQQWPSSSSADTTRQAYMRLFMIQKQKDLGVQISTEAVANFARRLLGQASLDDFTDKVLKPQGLDAADFERFIKNELGIEQLGMVVGVSGRLVTPQEAETMYRLEHQDIEAYLIHFSASNFLASVQIKPEIIGQFYTNQMANYRVPEMVQVSYVKFNVTNYFTGAEASITNLNQMVDANVQKFGTNLFQGAKTPEESKAAIRSAIIREHAMVTAHRSASLFAQTLDELKPHTTDQLDKLAATSNLTVQVTAPFDRDYGPQDKDLIVPPAFAQKAFGLAADEPFAGPIVADDGVYVIAFKQRIPSETPPLAKVEDKVTADFRKNSAIQLAQQSAIKFATTITNGLAAGKSFKDVCTEAGVKYEELPPFSLSTRTLDAVNDQIGFGMLKQVAFATPPGKISGLAGARDGAFMVYVDKQLPVDEAKVKKETPEFLAYMRSVRQNDSFNQWFNAEIHQDPDFLAYVEKMSQDSQTRGATARRTKS